VLCTYISATKTTEGVVRCIGALPRVDPWVSPVGAVADALFSWCHRPGADALTPPVDFAPVFTPNDEALVAAGVRPAHFREAGTDVGFCEWQRCLVVPGSDGDQTKAMSYRYHNDRLGKVLMAQGVPDWAAKTRLGRRAVAQMGKQRGAVESDIKEHGLWSAMIGGGTYEAAIPNRAMANALSGRAASCPSPSTPHLNVSVPQALQDTLCLSLEDAEKALGERISRDHRAKDEALRDFFLLVRWCRSVYFQTCAARLDSASVPSTPFLHRHPLLNDPTFTSYRVTMARALAAAGDTAASAVQQVLPSLATAVRVAVETVAAASAAESKEMERRLSLQMDEGVVAVKQHVDVGLSRVLAHGSAIAGDARSHLDTRFDVVEGDLRRMRELLARLVTDDVLRDPRAREIVRQELVRAPPPPPPGSSSAQMLNSASVPAVLSVAAPLPARVPARLTAAREYVRTLQAAGKLACVPVFESSDEYVPLLPMGHGLNWEMALDEYAVGMDGRVAIWDLKKLFGDRWRLRGGAKRRLSDLYSERAAVYRAFKVEYASRGSAVAVAGVVYFLKQRYGSGINKTKAVLSQLKKDYPRPTARRA